MGRSDGFVVADVSSGHFDDDKVRKLWRRLQPDAAAMCEAMTVHLAVVLASWRAGRRVTVEDALPLWLSPGEATVGVLADCGLLDRTGRIPMRSWNDWFGPAQSRKEARVEAGRLGGLAKAQRSSSGAKATPERRSTRPYRPSVPTDPSSPSRAPAREGGAATGPTSLADALNGTPLGEAIAARKKEPHDA
jgi:hypothetical protein